MDNTKQQYHVWVKDALGGQVLVYATYDKAMARRVLLAALGGGHVAWLRRPDQEDAVSWAE